jgi:hypothetical protein
LHDTRRNATSPFGGGPIRVINVSVGVVLPDTRQEEAALLFSDFNLRNGKFVLLR